MTERSYIPLTLDFLERYEELTHEEMGRLIRALLAYAKGADPSPYLTENLQKYCFRAERDMLDRTFKAYQALSEKRKAAAQLAVEARATKRNQTSPNVTNRCNNNNNNKNNNNNNNNSGGANSVRRTDYPSGTHGPIGGETVL